jgi:hypothetical protein
MTTEAVETLKDVLEGNSDLYTRELDAIREVLAVVEDCERDHPPEPWASELEAEVETLRAEREEILKSFRLKVEECAEALKKNERLRAERDEARSAVASFPFGHLMRCAKVNGKQVCAKGCPQAKIEAALALHKTRMAGPYCPECGQPAGKGGYCTSPTVKALGGDDAE